MFCLGLLLIHLEVFAKEILPSAWEDPNACKGLPVDYTVKTGKTVIHLKNKKTVEFVNGGESQYKCLGLEGTIGYFVLGHSSREYSSIQLINENDGTAFTIAGLPFVVSPSKSRFVVMAGYTVDEGPRVQIWKLSKNKFELEWEKTFVRGEFADVQWFDNDTIGFTADPQGQNPFERSKFTLKFESSKWSLTEKPGVAGKTNFYKEVKKSIPASN